MPSNVGGLVYGTITVAALLAAERAQRETYPETVGAVLIAIALLWVAHAYAEYTAQHLKAAEKLSVVAFGRTMVHDLSILLGAAIPLLILLVSWAAGSRLTTAVTGAIWSAAAVLALIELAAALRARLTGRELIAQVSVGLLLGLLVIAIKLVLH
jgi:hypothetical protein